MFILNSPSISAQYIFKAFEGKKEQFLFVLFCFGQFLFKEVVPSILCLCFLGL